MSACPLCRSHDLRRGRSDYAFCLRCGLAVAWALTPQKVETGVYRDPNYYRNAGYLSPGFLAHHRVLASIISERLAPKSAILEIGCGVGTQLQALAELGHDVVGMDLSEQAKTLAAERGVPVVIGNAERDPIPLPTFRYAQNPPDDPQPVRHPIDGDVVEAQDAWQAINFPRPWWDCVMMSHTLEHFFHPVETMQKVVDTVAPGGWWVNIMPDLDQPEGVLGHVKPWEHVALWGKRQLDYLAKYLNISIIEHYQRTTAGECVTWFQKTLAEPPSRRVFSEQVGEESGGGAIDARGARGEEFPVQT